ncbi:MAG: hypothetical protein OXH41_04230 [Chloroflexi bacterium]|nr:hypothetical protein [Chloroflexota bacterium]
MEDSYCYDFNDHECLPSHIEPVYTPVWLDASRILFFFFRAQEEREDSREGAGGGGLYVLQTRGEVEVRRFTRPSGVDERFADDYSPTLAPDGTTVVYATLRLKTSGGEHNFEIVSSSLELDGEEVRRLTKTINQDTNPVVSPDGERIAFVRTEFLYSEPGLRVMNPDGTRSRRLAPNVGIRGTPAWSPDGRKLAFVGTDEGTRVPFALYVVDRDGPNLTRLIEALSGVAWSPDGQLLAYNGPHPGYHDQHHGQSVLYVVNSSADLADGEARMLIEEPCSAFLWSPDGREVLCAGWWSGLIAADVETGEIRVIRPTDRGVLGMAWAPDGRTLAVRMTPMQAPHSCGGLVLYTIDRDGSDYRPQVLECDGELTIVGADTTSLPEEQEGTGRAVAR